MTPYPKIQTLYKRTSTGALIMGVFSQPEFEYLRNIQWIFTEKVDGTNIRVMWDGKQVQFGGRTDNAQIPAPLVNYLNATFTAEKMLANLEFPESPICLYGEGYGAKIQKGGGNYIPDGVAFVLFDVRADVWWLQLDDVCDIAKRLGLKVVPFRGQGMLCEMTNMVKRGLQSFWGGFYAEGLVARPVIELKDRAGRRIITKLKHKDFLIT